MYAYLHVNGKVLQKPDIVVDTMPGGAEEYFDSPYVVKWWKVETEKDLDTPPTILNQE